MLIIEDKNNYNTKFKKLVIISMIFKYIKIKKKIIGIKYF